MHPGGQLEPEIKYAYLRSHWGCGFATEAVQGLIAYGVSAHDLDYIIATPAPANLASHRVLLKAGMLRGELHDAGTDDATQVFFWQATSQ